MILRPYGVVLGGALELGLELVVEGGRIAEIRPRTGVPENWVASVPFTNAHSHLEYRGLQGKIKETEYWPWIREITRLRPTQSAKEVRRDCLVAARENKRSGVASIGEHTDRPGAVEALIEAGIGGVLFQELITFNEQRTPNAKVAEIQARAAGNRGRFCGEVGLAPHAPYTVDDATLRLLAKRQAPMSIHLAEHPDEGRMFRDGDGPVAEFYVQNGFEPRNVGMSPTAYLEAIGFFAGRVQAVHCCDVDDVDIDTLARNAVSIAHCPRSNAALGCPVAPVRRMLEAGLMVGIGMDSAASSGPIDMFAEMRAALASSSAIRQALAASQVWQMATEMGAASLGHEEPWKLRSGWCGCFLAIESDAQSTEELIEKGKPEHIRWIDPSQAEACGPDAD